MATKFIVQHRRGTAEEWEQSGIVPYNGEIVIEVCQDGTFKTKIGDGAHTFPELPYQNLDSELLELKQYVDGKVVDGLLYENNLLYLTLGGEIVSAPVEITGGGGGGTSYIARLINGMSSNTLTVAASDKTMLTASFYEYYGEISTGVNGTLEVAYKLSTDGEWVIYSKQNVAQNTPFSVNVVSILTTDKITNIRFTVTDGESDISRSLTDIILPETLTNIGAMAFYGCAMSTVVIPDSVQTIRIYLFSECHNLITITKMCEKLTPLGVGWIAQR